MGTLLKFDELAKIFSEQADYDPHLWTISLYSERSPIFQRVPYLPKDKDSIGPTLDYNGNITRDIFLKESCYFESVAKPVQKDFNKALVNLNESASKRYILTISRLVDIWKRDMKWLNVALHYLEKEEHELEKIENNASKGEICHYVIKFPNLLKRHFPGSFDDFVIDGTHPETPKKLRETLEKKIRPEEKLIKTYLGRMKDEMPYLFDAA
jgi:hypothetical protein